MTQFGASLRFVELPAVAEFLASVAGTGRLRISWGEWTAEIVLRRGLIVAASLGNERGLAALESIAVGFLDGEFSFAHGPVAEDEPPLLDAQLAQTFLRRLNAERRTIVEVIDSLSAIPRLDESTEPGGGDVTIEAAALQIIPLLVPPASIEDLARRRGLGRAVRDVAALVKAGVVRLEEAGSDGAPEEAPSSAAPVIPTRVLAARRPTQSRAAGTTVRPTTHTRPTRFQPRPRPRTDSIDPPSPRPTLDEIDPASQAQKVAAIDQPKARALAEAIEPPRLYAQSALTAPYVRRTLVEADAPLRAPLAGWSDALARILRRPRREHGREPLFEPRYTYIRTQDPTLPG